MIRFLGWLIGILLILYIAVCLLFTFFQEHFLFFPKKLPADFRYTYPYEFEEYFIEVEKGIKLNALLFKAKPAKESFGLNQARGLVFFLHGNAGALDSWGYAAEEFLMEGYDVFILDYRGYGKSGGLISSQEKLFQDVELAYQEILKQYQEREIIITGFSIGSGIASWLASRYQPSMLILKAPYYSMKDLASHYFPFLPSFILRYPLNTNQYLQKVEAQVVLIHGEEDEIIPFESSLKLKEHLKEADRLFALKGIGHNTISGSSQYRKVLHEVLNE